MCDGGVALHVISETRYVSLSPARTAIIDRVPRADDAVLGMWVENASGTMQFTPRTSVTADEVYCGLDPTARRFVERATLSCVVSPDGGSCVSTPGSTTLQEITGDTINMATYVMGRPTAAPLTKGRPAVARISNLAPWEPNDSLELVIPSANVGFYDLANFPVPATTINSGDVSTTIGFDLSSATNLLPQEGDDAYLTQLVNVDAGIFTAQVSVVSALSPVHFDDAGMLQLDYALVSTGRSKTFTGRFEGAQFAHRLAATYDVDLTRTDGGFSVAPFPALAFLDPIIGGANLGVYAGLPDLMVTGFQNDFGVAPMSDGGWDLNLEVSNPYPASSGYVLGSNFSFLTTLQLPDAGLDAGAPGKARLFTTVMRHDVWDGGFATLAPGVEAPSGAQVQGLPVALCAPGNQVCSVSGDLVLTWTPPATGPVPDEYLVFVAALPFDPANPLSFRFPAVQTTVIVKEPHVSVPRARLPKGLAVVIIAARSAPNRSPVTPFLTSLPESRAPLAIPVIFDLR
jgi:hypothetical protein